MACDGGCTRPADTLHTHNTNTSCDYYKCVSEVGHSGCNFLIFTNKTVIICPHRARSPANPLTLCRGRYLHQGTWGLGLQYQTTFIALSSFHRTSPFSTFQVYTLNSLLSQAPLSPAAGPARLANAAQVSDHDGGHDDCAGDHCSGEVISAKQTT